MLDVVNKMFEDIKIRPFCPISEPLYKQLAADLEEQAGDAKPKSPHGLNLPSLASTSLIDITESPKTEDKRRLCVTECPKTEDYDTDDIYKLLFPSTET